jgi:DNA repair protein RadC
MKQKKQNKPHESGLIFFVEEIQITYRYKFPPSQRQQVKTSSEAYKIFFSSWDKDKISMQEEFKILLLNRACKVLGIVHISSGGVSCTVVDPKLIFSAALKALASQIILCHSHPSGELRPSKADIDITNQLKQGGKLLDIQVIDHLIITDDGFFSFADEGLM